jgi:DNA-binding transcriptional ArsR family regulator
MAPIEVWDFDASVADEPQPNVTLLLRALAHETRLDVLRLLAAGQLETRAVARQLKLPVAAVRRHLRALTKAGLVQAEPRAGAEVYQLAQHAVRLLNATLI